MNKSKKPNFITISISNLLFCSILIIICAFITFKFELQNYQMLAFFCLLFTGIFCGVITTKSTSNKKLLNSMFSAAIFIIIYLISSFFYNGENAIFTDYILACFNVILGAVIGCIFKTNSNLRGR